MSKRILYNVYTTDPTTQRSLRVAQEVDYSTASELVRKYDRSGYSVACEIRRIDEDPQWFYEDGPSR